MEQTPLDRATKIIGGRRAVADLCGVSYSAVQQWETNGVPRDHILTLEHACRNAPEPVTARELLEWSTKRAEKAAA